MSLGANMLPPKTDRRIIIRGVRELNGLKKKTKFGFKPKKKLNLAVINPPQIATDCKNYILCQYFSRNLRVAVQK